MKFSIITPSYNQGRFIEATIRSVLSQEVDLEYWVIDGGSTDQTLTILRNYKKQFPNFNFISEPDRGQSDAINKGIQKAQGEMIAYLNSDDCYLPGALKKVEKIAQGNKLCQWFYGRSIIVDKDGKPIQSFFSKVKNFLGHHYSYHKLLAFNIISQPAVFLRKEIFDECGCFDRKHHQIMDYEYWLRIGKKYSPQPIHENLALYRYYDESKSGRDYLKQYYEELKMAFRYSHKIFHLPSILVHFFYFFLIVSWMRFMVK